MSKTFYTIILSVLILTISVSCVRRKSAMDTFMEQSHSSLNDVKLPVQESRTMTLCLGNNNKVLYFLGNRDKPLEGPVVTGYGKDSLDKAIVSMMGKMKNNTDSCLIVLIKPSDKSTYKNFVNTIDITNVVGVKSRAVVDITPKEVNMLKKYGAY